MRAAAYIRVSTDKEEQQSSLENQREFFEKYIPARGDELVAVYCDKGKSATKMQNRKDLQRLRKAAERAEFQKLYVKDISRLFRNTLDFITVTRELNSYGVSLHLVNMGEGKDIDSFTLNLMRCWLRASPSVFRKGQVWQAVRQGKGEGAQLCFRL